MNKPKSMIVTAALLGAWLLSGATGRAAESIFMSIAGIQGEVTQQGKEGQIEVFALNHEVAVPFDSATGLATGKRVHAPVKVVIRLSKATPLIAQALANNQNLTKVDLLFWRSTPTGADENYFKITLENCRVASRRLWSPNKLDSATAGYIPLEEISFVYQKITWTYTDGGIVFQDTWGAAVP